MIIHRYIIHTLIILFLLPISNNSSYATCASSSGMIYTVTVPNGNGSGTIYQAITNANNDNVGGRIVMGNGIDTIYLNNALPVITVDSLEIFPTSQYLFINGNYFNPDPIFQFQPSAIHGCLSDSVIIYNTYHTTISVINTNDSGIGSLRDAINSANQSMSVDDIVFYIGGQPPFTIYPSSPYFIRYGVTINGTTQSPHAGISPRIIIDGGDSITKCFDAVLSPFHSPNTLDIFELDNLNIHGFEEAISAEGWERVVIGHGWDKRNVISDNSVSGISISNCSYVSIGDNYIGTDSSGTIAQGNSIGITLQNIYDQTHIFGNVISGNNYGIWLLNTTGVHINSNKIGTDKSASFVIPNNLSGIHAINSSDMKIGLLGSSYENIICGTGTGISISGNSNNIIILNNYIGVTNTFVQLANTTGIHLGPTTYNANILDNHIAGNVNGIKIDNGASHSTIQDNFIYENDSSGIFCPGHINTFKMNSIWNNGFMGIELYNFGNDSIQPPVITQVNFSGVSGNSKPLAKIELFYNGSLNQFPQGKTYLNTVLADSTGNWTLSQPLLNSTDITATQKDLQGNTSGFAEILSIIDLGPDTAICLWEPFSPVGISGLSSFVWSTGDSTLTITPYTTGYYSLTGITFAGDTLYDTVYIDVVVCIHIKELNDIPVLVYPVPANDYFSLVVPNDISASGYFIEVINGNGAIVKSEYSNLSQMIIQLNQKGGIYFLRLTDKNKNCFFSKKLVSY